MTISMHAVSLQDKSFQCDVKVCHCLTVPRAHLAEKSGGAWENTLVSQSALLAAPGQSIRLPVAAIVTNQSPPVGDAPSLMTMEWVSWMPITLAKC